MLARDYCKAKKRNCGSSGDAVKDEDQMLHHSCWADDLYAMAGTMNHLTRIPGRYVQRDRELGHEMERKEAYQCCWAVH